MNNHFYFQTLLTTALDGISSGGITRAVQTTAEGILLATVLYQIYQVWFRDGDYHELGVTLVKAVVITGLLTQYDTVFRLAVDGFNSVADTIYTRSPGRQDLIVQYLHDLAAAW